LRALRDSINGQITKSPNHQLSRLPAPARYLKGYAVLRNRNYRFFWIGQWISLVGTWMQSVVQAWLLVRLGGGPLALGVLGAASSAPMLLLVLFGGVLSDRGDRKRVVIVTQILSLLQALALASLTLSGLVQPWHIIALAGVLGAINAFDIPARQAFVVELVGRHELPNAIALNSTGFNVARVAGPALGGLLVAAVGEGMCFTLNSLSYVAVLWGLSRIRLETARAPVPPQAREAGALRAGVRYAAAHADLRPILILVGIVSAIAVSYRNFLPAMAQTVLNIDAWRYGLLTASAGVGAGVAAMILAGVRLGAATYRRILPAGLAVFALALAAFAESRSFALSLALLWASGCGGIVYFNASHTLVQLCVEDDFRGRVVSLYTLMHQGTAAFGSLVLGFAAAHYGTPAALLGGAVVCAAAGVWFVGRKLFGE
jgi:MFS family permease